jgi:PrtD family type I secretion system ABC transporter
VAENKRMMLLKQNVIFDLLRPYSRALISLIFFSFFTSLLYLVPSIYMMQLSERVMLSRNFTTLLFLTVIAVFLLLVMTAVDSVRSRALRRISIDIDQRIGQSIFDTLNRKYLDIAAPAKSLILGDLNTFREFIGGPIVTYLLDLFWVPMILAVLFIVHLFLGLTMLVLTIVTVALTIANQHVVAEDLKRSQAALAKSQEFARAVARSADVARPMGMLPALGRRWRASHNEGLGWQFVATERSEWITGVLRFLRNSQQIILMVVGVSLFLYQEVSAGAIFAVIFIGMRAVAPVAAVAASWRNILNFLSSVERLNVVLKSGQNDTDKMSLPRPRGAIAVSRVVLTPPNGDTVLLNDVSFALQNGKILGVVGPSGAGKTSLAKLLVGAWRPRRGSVILDEHDLAHWDQDELGRYIGYVPQEVEFLPGTVAENISRFRDDGPIDYEAVLEAAELAGVQDIIQALPEGYNTRIGSDGHVFSGGQRQRIALARAVYGNPSLLVLDEPNSNLDTVGEQGLGRTLTLMRSRGATVVIITHRVNMLQFCDELLVMNAGTVHTFGSRDTIMSRLSAYRPTNAAVLEAVGKS